MMRSWNNAVVTCGIVLPIIIGRRVVCCTVTAVDSTARPGTSKSMKIGRKVRVETGEFKIHVRGNEPKIVEEVGKKWFVDIKKLLRVEEVVREFFAVKDLLGIVGP